MLPLELWDAGIDRDDESPIAAFKNSQVSVGSE
jgi:hypothetical protein